MANRQAPASTPWRSVRESHIAWLILLTVLLVNAAALWPELSISRVDRNDNVSHFTLVERMAHALERGENPRDVRSPEWTLGYPVPRTCQPLAHLLVVGRRSSRPAGVDQASSFFQ